MREAVPLRPAEIYFRAMYKGFGTGSSYQLYKKENERYVTVLQNRVNRINAVFFGAYRKEKDQRDLT